MARSTVPSHGRMVWHRAPSSPVIRVQRPHVPPSCGAVRHNGGMRIISGRFKGLEIAAPHTGTRPTTDRTKEAIFSHLESWGLLDGTRVLDLFAGTGALGFEALSRGASALVSVEAAGPAAASIGKTLQAMKRSKAWDGSCTARVVRGKAEKFVAAYRQGGEAFDVVFIDPPYAYETTDCEALLTALVEHGMVAADGEIVLERSGRSQPAAAPTGWVVSNSKKYGETTVFYIDRDDSDGSDDDGSNDSSDGNSAESSTADDANDTANAAVAAVAQDSANAENAQESAHTAD